MEARKLTDTECTLYGTKACRVLNMRSCKDCPLAGRKADPAIVTDLKLFESLLPEGGVAQLFESEKCTLCKGEEADKGDRSGYCVFDMCHSEPKKLARRKYFFRNTMTGFVLPLQFACCKKCRLRILLMTYLPLIVPLVLTAMALPFVTIERTLQQLRAIGTWFPFALVLFTIVGGYIIGKLISLIPLKKRYDQLMVTDVALHPFVDKMREKGWRPLFNDKHTRTAFTKKRIDRGLGSAPSKVYDAPWEDSSAESSAEPQKVD